MEISSVNIKQEPEAHFVLVLPPYEPADRQPQHQLKLNLRKIKFDNKVEAKLFDTFQQCKKCEKCLKNNAGVMAKHRLKVHQQKQLECDECGTAFQTKMRMLCHLRAKKCFLCSDEFKCSTPLHEHIKEKHKDESGYFHCPRNGCRSSSKLLRNLRLHLRNVHRKKQKCKVCSKVLTQNSMKDHILRMHPEMTASKKFECDFCDFKTPIKVRLRQHMKIHLKFRLKKFECDRCGHCSFTKINMKTHLTSRSSKCYYCEAEFKCKLLLDRHCKNEHNTSEDKWKCETCKNSFSRASDLKNHQTKMQHGKFVSQPLKFFNCVTCSKNFKSRESYLQHLKHFHNSKCDICSSKFESADQLEQLQQSENLKCGFCSKSAHEAECKHCGKFFLGRRLLRHLRVSKCLVCSVEFPCDPRLEQHVDEEHRDSNGKIQCPHIECVKSFEHSKNLKLHLRECHVDEKLRTCLICFNVSSSTISLKSHIRQVHSDKKAQEKKLECDSCSYKAKHKFEMRIHIETHLENRLTWYECDLCGDRLTAKRSLRRHLSSKSKKCFYCEAEFKCKLLLDRHHKEAHKSWSGNWPCETCEKISKNLSILKNHQKSKRHGKFEKKHQEMFKCTKCQKEFKARKVYLQHLKDEHNEVLNRKCHICSITFRSADCLKIHLVNHEQVDTFKCKICTYVTKYKWSLKNHLKSCILNTRNENANKN